MWASEKEMGKWIDCNRRDREREGETTRGEVGEKSDATDTLKLQKGEMKVPTPPPPSATGRHALQ